MLRLRQLSKEPSSPLFGAQVLELEGRHGFGLALQEGMKLVSTEFVMVAQHDWVFVRKSLDLRAAIRTMEQAVAAINHPVRDSPEFTALLWRVYSESTK